MACEDRMRQGCRIRAYTDVFTACPSRPYVSAGRNLCSSPRALRRVPLAAPFRILLQGAAADIPVRSTRHHGSGPLA
jgi:hypothetical protein